MGAARVSNASYVVVLPAVLEICRTVVPTLYRRVLIPGTLAMQLIKEACDTSVDDDTEPPLSVNFKTVKPTLMKRDAEPSMPHTIPVTPAPEYHSLHTWSGVHAMT
jgi:hypothetical protein